MVRPRLPSSKKRHFKPEIEFPQPARDCDPDILLATHPRHSLQLTSARRHPFSKISLAGVSV